MLDLVRRRDQAQHWTRVFLTRGTKIEHPREDLFIEPHWTGTTHSFWCLGTCDLLGPEISLPAGPNLRVHWAQWTCPWNPNQAPGDLGPV